MTHLFRRATKELFIIFLICGTFLVSYFLFSFVSFYLNTSSQYAEILEKRKLNLESIADSFDYILQDKPSIDPVNCDFKRYNLPIEDQRKLNHLTALLLTLTKAGNINFSLLRYQGTSLFNTRGSRYSCEIDPALEADYPVMSQTQTLRTVMIRTIAQGPFKITMGIPILTGKHVIEEFFSSIKVFFNDTLSLTLIFFIFVAYYFSDLLFLYRVIGKSNWKELLHERATSEKSKTIIRFLHSMLKENVHLENENQKLKHGFESVYLRYIESEEFLKKLDSVVYIELDWKDHTPYVAKFGLNEIIKIRNKINHIGRVLVSRYNGLMLEAKSDMVSFIVECGTLQENKLLALSCVRDFFKALSHLEGQLENKEIKIKYRGTMVVGDFEFQITEHNYNLNSMVYYVASRLSKISKSTGHHVTLLAQDTNGLVPLFELSPPMTETLKGLGEHSFCEIKKFASIEEVLAQEQWDYLNYFRNEDDLMQIMNFCTQMIKINESSSQEFKNLNSILKQLRGYHLDDLLITADLHESYLELLQAATKKCDEHIVAAIVSLSKTFFAVNMNNREVETYFKMAGNTTVPRVRANIVEAYNQLTSYQDQQWNSSHLEFDNNRVIGNVIIAACQEEVSEFYRKKIKELLLSDEDRYVASGIFVLGHLYRLFYIKNKIYFSNNDWFKNIPDAIQQFSTHPNEMIHTRAKEEYNKILSLE